MKSGLAINIPSSFTRVLSDLSFIPDVNEDALTYTGLFGGSLGESLVNSASDAAGNVIEIVGRSTERLSFNKGFFSFIGPGADISAGTGIRVRVKSDNLITAGYPCTIAVAFKSIRKAAKEQYRRQYPIMSFFTNPWSTSVQPALLLSATMLDTGQNILGAWSGGIQGATTDTLASRCSVPIDWKTTDEVICAAISRAADGRINLAVKKGSDAVLTSTFAFPVQTPPDSPTGPYILFGTSESRTLDSGDVLMGQYWHNTALTMSELQQQVALIHLKANARL
ncbi:hypothetical protein GOY43_25615 [Klebsiella pneumoniae]|uniref:hypothetical protein n=1 Tax=Klebsiella pneumoniae TaxID=573 RepID=UPI001FADF700|nr:hypothetical protein [Klebsiella pneumoniae]MCI7829865.1 hypothetical protein [Klebsiella pneumoniae]MCI7865795.1 hypothetical protein [Klebsiella pneumoniae]